MSLKRLFLSFFLLFILPIGNVWAARGSKRPGSPLHNPRYAKYRRQNPARQEGRYQRQERHQGHRHDRPYTQRRDDRGYYAQRPPQASGYDAPRNHKTKMSLNSLFKQIEGDLRRHNSRLEKHLDALCEASYQRDFNFISVARAFSMLSRFAKNNPNRCHAIKAHRSFVPRMMQVAQQQMQGNLCNARSFANLLYGCMKLSITPDEAWERSFWQNSQDKLSGFKPQHFSNTLYAACVLDLTIPETVKPLVQSTVTSNTEEDIRHLHAMYSAKDYLQAQGINLVFKENTPEKLRQSEDTRVSQLEKKTGFALAKVLQSMRPQTLLNAQHFIRSTASPVDFFIELCGDQGLVIQVDGPCHFLDKGTKRQCVNGFTAFQTRHFKKAGYQVLRLPYDLLNKYGVYDIEDENSPIPKALAAYLKEQLTPYLALTT